MTFIYFYKKDISSFLIGILELVNAILLEIYKNNKTTVKKNFKNNHIDQLTKINDNKTFF